MSKTNRNATPAGTAAPRAADKAPATPVALDPAVPEALRAMAETSALKSREAYERVKAAMEESVEVLEAALDTAGRGAASLNQKVIDATQSNLNAGFELAKDLSQAKNLAEMLELQSAYMRGRMEILAAQAEEIQKLSLEVASETAEPLKAQVERSMKLLKTAA